MVVVFGTLALLITAAGLYGVIAFIVSQRTREIGIRVALGAHKRDVARLVAGHAARPLLGGVLLGTVGAFCVGRLLHGLVTGGRGGDPLILAAGTLVVLLSATLAVLAPARSAAAIDPIAVLRRE
jgi:putative ABC transport system permease protein